jgi:hypothetical protein
MTFLSERLSKSFGFGVSACVALISLGISGFALPGRCAHASTHEAAIRVFDISSDTAFKGYKQAVTEFARKHRPKAANDFCVVGYLADDNSKSAWTIWRQGGEIILWEGQDSDLDSSRRIINLKSDVVATDDDVRGSTYLVTKAWVANVTATCEQSGIKVHVPRATHRVNR